jgi:hypothetical protein
MTPTRIACAILTIYCVASSSSLFSQMPKKPAFEVATVKPLPSMQSLFEEIRSGKRSQDSLKTTVDGARVDIGASPMMELLTRAYKVRPYQVIDDVAILALVILRLSPQDSSVRTNKN